MCVRYREEQTLLLNLIQVYGDAFVGAQLRRAYNVAYYMLLRTCFRREDLQLIYELIKYHVDTYCNNKPNSDWVTIITPPTAIFSTENNARH